jgi:DNA-binding MarR family transcriptional regulator
MSEPTLQTRHDDADDSPGLLLWQVTNRWQAAVRAALKPLGLTHVQFVLLASLTWLEASGPVSQRRLAGHAVTDPMMTSQVLRALEQRGLVERAEDPDDRRARAVRVSAAGAELANRAVGVVEQADEAFFGALGEGLGGFGRSLRQLRDQGPTTSRT